ncbi:hypothetical protein ACGFS9_29385 [Streptomyces sp. NPDC048566]|uniref:hypothetical protein n=1 Tax=Streptomyces sp. NPDC048566 TaxID=3365569 RepID=UPI00371428EA
MTTGSLAPARADALLPGPAPEAHVRHSVRPPANAPVPHPAGPRDTAPAPGLTPLAAAELAVAAESGDEASRTLARRLVLSLSPEARCVLLGALAETGTPLTSPAPHGPARGTAYPVGDDGGGDGRGDPYGDFRGRAERAVTDVLDDRDGWDAGLAPYGDRRGEAARAGGGTGSGLQRADDAPPCAPPVPPVLPVPKPVAPAALRLVPSPATRPAHESALPGWPEGEDVPPGRPGLRSGSGTPAPGPWSAGAWAMRVDERPPEGVVRLRFADEATLERARAAFAAGPGQAPGGLRTDPGSLTLQLDGEAGTDTLRAVLHVLDTAAVDARSLTVHSRELGDIVAALTWPS